MNGVRDLIGFVLIFGMILVVSTFTFLFITNLFSEEILPKTIDQLENQDNIPAEQKVFMNEQLTKYENFDFNINMIFILVIVLSLISTTIMAWFLPPLPSWNFITILFIGMFAILFGFNYVVQIYEWFVQEFIYNVFSVADTNIQALLFWTENQTKIVFTWVVWILFINQLSNIVQKKQGDTENVVIEE